ncbi:MAG: Ig-like domain-containing protein, partial [Oscillospiraceae bacterium]|nr:Ig-like domain-containing protein [Oscillospiraceae bacterium]
GKTQQFTATVSGTGDFNKDVAWAVSGGTASTINANGLLTVGADETAATLTVIVRAAGDTTKTASATVTVTEPSVAEVTGISIDPASASVEQGKTQQFTATVSGTGDFNKDVAWAVSGGTASTINANGLLTVGADETAATLTVIVRAAGDTTKTASATVTVKEPVHTHTYNGINEYDDENHWEECTDPACPDLKGSWQNESGHSGMDTDKICDVCGYDARTQLTNAAFTMTNHDLGKKLTDIVFTAPAGISVYSEFFGIDTDSVPGPDDNAAADAVVEADKEYWVALEIEAAPGNILPAPETKNFTLNGAEAEDVLVVSAVDGDDAPAAVYTVVFKLPVLADSAHGHSYAHGVYKHDDTYHWQECSGADCNDRTGSIINKAKHTGGTATCLAKATCSVCGEEYGKKLAHDYSEWVVVKEPTDTTYGKKERTCSMCKGVHMEYIPPLGQNPQTGDTNDVFLWGAALAASLLGLTGVVVYTKKKKREE